MNYAWRFCWRPDLTKASFRYLEISCQLVLHRGVVEERGFRVLDGHNNLEPRTSESQPDQTDRFGLFRNWQDVKEFSPDSVPKKRAIHLVFMNHFTAFQLQKAVKKSYISKTFIPTKEIFKIFITVSHRAGCKPSIMTAMYKIENYPVQLFSWETNLYRTKVFLATTWILWTAYMLLQLLTARSFQNETELFQWRMWTAIFAEFCLSFQELVYALSLILSLFGASNKSPRPSLRLTGKIAPSVAVLITCCGEPVDNIMNTVCAAATQDYPCEELNVFILDDGHDESLRLAIEALDLKSANRGWAKIKYLSRKVKPGTKSFFKAGNLQFGIEETKRNGNSDFVAGLDADMIPRKDWLRKMVPHVLTDAETAMAMPPQVRNRLGKSWPCKIANEISRIITMYQRAIHLASVRISPCTLLFKNP